MTIATCVIARQMFLRARTVCATVLFCVCAASAALAQTTQGLISGQLIDNVTGRPIAAASVLYESAVSNLAGASMSDSSGYYYLPLLSPGFYRVRVTAPAY